MPIIIYTIANDFDPPPGKKWLLIEEDENGKWYGTGFGFNSEGKDTIYVSTSDTDTSYDLALSAAKNWADENAVTAIYVRRIGTSDTGSM
jgi:hypothetical protein